LGKATGKKRIKCKRKKKDKYEKGGTYFTPWTLMNKKKKARDGRGASFT